jgi:hypothetical protein
MRKILLSIATMLCLTAITMAQNVPNYVPTNGLVGWWPFNGNANDESGNNLNLTIVGSPLLSNDRFNNPNKSYYLNGTNDYFNTVIGQQDTLSISTWVNRLNNNTNSYDVFFQYGQSGNFTGQFAHDQPWNDNIVITTTNNFLQSNNPPSYSTWHNIVAIIVKNGYSKLYINGLFVDSSQTACNPINTTNYNLYLGNGIGPGTTFTTHLYKGFLDDIGIWNRALTPQEITNLYNGNICYQNITVTDTLLINMGITGFNPVTYQNTIKVWPNPTNDHITIDNGNLANLNGYQIKIMNSLSQQVFQSAITQQQFYINLSSWTGNGIYFVHIIDGQGNTVDVKKIILQ